MNGISGAREQREGGIRLLCPVCHKKLKQNINFDSIERFEKLTEACQQLGFADEEAIYRKLLADCNAAKIKPQVGAASRLNQAVSP